MKWSLVFTMACMVGVFSACAFRSQSPAAPVIDSRNFSWSFDGTNGKPTALERVFQGTGPELTATQVVTLPEKIPQEIKISGVLPANFAYPKIESSVLIGEQSFDVRAKNFERLGADNVKNFALEVEGFQSVFSAVQGEEGVLQIKFQENGDVFELKQALRTPPALLKVAIQTPSAFAATSARAYERFRSIDVNQKQITLLRVVSVQNDADDPVRFEVPVSLGGKFFQSVLERRYRDIGCVGAGYALDEIRSQDAFSSEVYFLPLRQDLVSKAARLTEGRVDASQEIQLAAKSKVDFGIYAIGDRPRLWGDRQGFANQTQIIGVPAGCKRVCLRYNDSGRGGECGRCGVSRPRARRWIASCAPRGCVEWGIERIPANVEVGFWRESFGLELPGTSVTAQVRFLSQDANDPEGRTLSLVEKQSLVEQ